MHPVDSLLCGHPKPIALTVICEVCQADWLIHWLGAGAWCLRGLCTGAVLPVFLGGSTLLGPMAQLATIVAFTLVAPSPSIVGSCGGQGLIYGVVLLPLGSATFQSIGLLA
jgi:hypothetical protein